ncbi:hypothetical protein MCOR31_008923 [Pyricularia oryzae]|uniref:Uncharacterized protein n=1 Tax=Pyricularia grisea TaxID=148305 RepID=A0ABQ8N9E2_PYRGI|nr:hypothetical protein MCOR33_010093 [Pyricularia grisea]KAI6360895.1 hypothetical protein MCOR31_008923 [Pyricularia oryzae]KAI6419415.1 hypothetical protein MCOR21_010298 [Pyricularia oryzae]KAI6420035.1 hypothetical protein MCOR24_004825 [Pyricularia oryzae]KAI6453265.1 hypothetical protein MCOR15_008686 [Pyricularia oryzae]
MISNARAERLGGDEMDEVKKGANETLRRLASPKKTASSLVEDNLTFYER